MGLMALISVSVLQLFIMIANVSRKMLSAWVKSLFCLVILVPPCDSDKRPRGGNSIKKHSRRLGRQKLATVRMLQANWNRR